MSKRQEDLFIDFKKSFKKDWIEKATSDLKGEDVFKKYNWNFENQITLEPYYDKSDLDALKNINAFQNRLVLKENPTGENRYWENLQKIIVKDDATANKSALEGLNNGADGVIFDLTLAGVISFENLLKDILIDYCNISFVVGVDYKKQLIAYTEFIDKKGIDPQAVTGVIFFNEDSISPEDYLEVFEATINLPGLKSLNIKTRETSASEAISALLHQTTRIINALDAAQFNIDLIISNISFSIPVATDYFGEIAKIRATRNLFYQLAQAYQFKSFKPEDLHIHCISTLWAEEKYQPHANMLKATTSAMSAILGGCDSLQVEPEDYNSALLVRIARNVSTILKEESYLNKTTDPAAGAYYIEVLTDKIAQKAWQNFQQKVNQEKEEIYK